MLGILITALLRAAYWHTWMKGKVCVRVTVCNSTVLKLLCYLGRGNQPWLASLLVLSHFTTLVIVLNSVPRRLQTLCLKIHWHKSVHYRAALLLTEGRGMSRMQTFFYYCDLTFSYLLYWHLQRNLGSHKQASLLSVWQWDYQDHTLNSHTESESLVIEVLVTSHFELKK